MIRAIQYGNRPNASSNHMTTHLACATLSRLPHAVARPTARPAGIGIVHLGLGAFHRAHQVDYTDDALARAGTPTAAWGICGVSLKTSGARDKLAAQDGLFTLVEKSIEAVRRRVLGSLLEARFLADERGDVEARMTDARTRIVSLTITEKGYGHDPASGRLNPAHAEIAPDLQHPDSPGSAVGLIVAALAARRRAGTAPFTVLCCDNLPHNGALLRGLVLDFARMRDDALAQWIESAVTFPSTMVDRIVPSTTAQDIADNDAALGVSDVAPVVCEPFRQWVIEDRFVGERPRWELAGAELVDDVAPFEAMKLRLLNGSHSALAYLGFLAGYDFIYQVAAQDAFVAYMRALMAESVPALHVPARVDLAAYQHALVTRFRNPALPHRTRQIAMDGSQKLPQRLLGTVRDNLAASRPIERLALAVAAWMRYVAGYDQSGRSIDVSDPLAARFTDIAGAHRGDVTSYARALLDIDAVFGDLGRDARFVTPVIAWLERLFAAGAARTVAECNARP
jgi:fructuronate reductase